jgi:uncharacterized protein (DUF58 family)
MRDGVKNAPEKQRSVAFFPTLRAGETRSERLEQTFPRRGRRRQTLQVSTRFPFGFFRRRNPLPSQELLVYPAIGKIPEFLQSNILSGRRESRQRGSGDNFYSIREYQDGESARAIDWKATAKAQKLMAREYAREDEIRCLLILDTYRSSPEKGESEEVIAKPSSLAGNAGILPAVFRNMQARRPRSHVKSSAITLKKNDQDDELFEKAISLAAGLATRFIKDGASLEFLTPEVYIPADSGDRHLYRILETLALTRISPQPFQNLQSKIKNQKSKIHIILTPLPAESFPAGIRRFSRIIPFETLRREE